MLRSWLSLIYPDYCHNCHRLLYWEHKDLCPVCRNLVYNRAPELTFTDQAMRRLTFLSGCGQVYALGRFEKSGNLQSLLHDMKYGNRPDIATALGARLGTSIVAPPDVIVPVPMTELKLAQRGYNQSLKMAQGIAQKIDVPVGEQIMTRFDSEVSQAMSSREDRWVQASTCYGINKANSVDSKHVLLVDDVITTGATITTCTRLLKQAGASRVDLACVAIS